MHQSQPDSAAMLQRIAALLMQAGDLINAEKAVNQALEKDPELAAAQGTRIVLEQLLGKTEQALTHARQMRDNQPDRAIGYRLIGDILMSSGDFQGAAESYSAGLGLEPDSDLLMLQFRAQYSADDGVVPWSLLTEWIAKYPDDHQIHNILGTLYNRAGKPEIARIHFEKVLNLRPDHGPTYNDLAMVYHKLAMPQALEVARRAYAIEPNDPAINDTLGWLLVQSGDYQDGLEYLRQAQVRSSENPEVGYHLAVALNGLKRPEEAVRELKAAIAQNEKFTGYDAARVLLQKIADNKNHNSDQ
jgi:tetratricopeptide (TPR) repeat protein